jgi:hypothetical protein
VTSQKGRRKEGLVADEAGQVADGLAYVCEHVDQIREDLDDEGTGDVAPLELLLAAVREGTDPAGPLEALHTALQARGDALGVYGHLRTVGFLGSHLPGVPREPIDVVYLCPAGRCSRYCWPQAGTPPPCCTITGESLRRERL